MLAIAMILIHPQKKIENLSKHGEPTALAAGNFVSHRPVPPIV